MRVPFELTVLCLASVCGGGCATRPPTIAHVHIGHAITGVHVTPDKEGYMSTAQRRAREAVDEAEHAAVTTDLADIKEQIAAANKATNSKDDFGVKESLMMAVNHVSFAASSDDASLNVQQTAPAFAANSARVIERCDLIELLSRDVQRSTSLNEASVSVAEIAKLARANLNGEDLDGDGRIGDKPAEYGLEQLRQELQEMIARERPPYVTVDQWYLFNLVRLPNGRWVFDKLGRGGNIEGYK